MGLLKWGLIGGVSLPNFDAYSLIKNLDFHKIKVIKYRYVS